MTATEKIVREINELPESVFDEIMDFGRCLKQEKKHMPPEIMRLSEATLRKDWINEAEGEAWKNL